MKSDTSTSELESRRGIEVALDALGHQTDANIDLAESALLLAAYDDPTLRLEPYRRHLAALIRDVAADGVVDSVAERAERLHGVIAARWGYRGDAEHYDDIANASLARVIDRRKGLPVALGVLYIHAAQGQGWAAAGLNFPGHFLVRIDGGGERLIIDPFNEGRVLAIGELRQLLKVAEGDGAELEAGHYEAVGNRDILLRLQNNLRMRLFRTGEVKRAAAIVAAKPTNERSAAEPVERRAEAKGNAGQQSTGRTQSRGTVSQALERIRHVASISRRAVTHLRWEPYARIGHVRICAGCALQAR